ncbi:MAG: hypothetical protein KIT84_19125 [Labilithrix sp.]|nr:hypothetical protein [Labilithrix sp.]MCW5813148.1 hypothetical protein [Labilithrix sp.]
MSDENDEARAILALCDGDKLKAFEKVEAQLAVLVLRTQVMLSLSGIVITVTGFSGRAIADTGALARGCIASGLTLVLAAAACAMWGVLRLKWLTQMLRDDVLETLRTAIQIRNHKSRFLRAATALFIAGFSLYVAAVAQLLVK